MPQNQTIEHVAPRLVSVPTIHEEAVEELPKWVTPEGVKQDSSNTVPIPKQEPVPQPVITPVAKTAPVIPTPQQAPIINVVEEVVVVEEIVVEEIIDEPIAVNDSPKPAKGKRASIPSWDEILFGSKGGQ
jgi:hypothetical protein